MADCEPTHLTRRDTGLLTPAANPEFFLRKEVRSGHAQPPSLSNKTAENERADLPHALALMCSRRISSTRACHPAPEVRNAATTSGDRRIETGTFVGTFCGPRLRLEIFWRNLEGSLSNVTARANSSRVHSGFSGSLACLTALFVFSGFMLGRLSQADRPHIFAFFLVREDQRI